MARRSINYNEWQEWTGGHYEIGRQLGYFWGSYLKKWQNTALGKNYIKLINTNWNPSLDLLYSKVGTEFPELLVEAMGVLAGTREAGWRASLAGILSLILGETDEELIGCSSIAVKHDNSCFIGHNEEDECIYPLCFAKVRLNGHYKDHEFLSVSYPFQYFGGSVGASNRVAFSGNSIGLGKSRDYVRDTFSNRIPKSVLSRKMLESDSLEDFEKRLCSVHSTLPGHWFACDQKQAVSYQTRIGDVNSKPPVEVIKCHKELFSTNHFQDPTDDTKVDLKWNWLDRYGKPAFLPESINRLALLKKLRAEHPECNTDTILKALVKLRESYRTTTSASIVFEVKPDSIVCRSVYYGGGKIKETTAVLENTN